MTWTLATAKDRLGIPQGDTDQDAAITAAMAATIGIVEGYCGRLFLKATGQVETFFRNTTRTLQLMLYPLIQVTEVTFDTNLQDPTTYSTRPALGQVLISGQLVCDTAVVTYDGGYDPVALPPDLELAFWGVFDGVWANSTSGTVAGGIASIQVPDVGTIRFTGDAASSIYGSYEAILAPYMMARC